MKNIVSKRRLISMVMVASLMVGLGCEKEDPEGNEVQQEFALEDIDGNTYRAINIGTQVWMTENLRVTQYNDGTPIPNPETDNDAWDNATEGAYSWYDNDQANKDTYGALYNWYAVDRGNLCPAGWRVPDVQDWLKLSEYIDPATDPDKFPVSETAGKSLKTSEHWLLDTDEQVNEYGFNALPAGVRENEGNFRFAGSQAQFWSNDGQEGFSDFFKLQDSNHWLIRSNTEQWVGMSVRCIREQEYVPGE